MKKIIFLSVAAVVLAATAFVFAGDGTGKSDKQSTANTATAVSKTNVSAVNDCPLKGTPDCPLVKDCPKKGQPDCPYAKAAADSKGSVTADNAEMGCCAKGKASCCTKK